MNSSSIDSEKLCAAFNLEGVTLKNGWSVTKRVAAKPNSTGSNFSVCYLVEKDGIEGFMKVLNVLSFFNSEGDMAQAMADMSSAYLFEKEILSRCSNKNLSKVSRLLEADQENIPGYFLSKVLYMIFEKAENDVRAHLNFAIDVDIAWKLRSLHNIAIGMKQLHSVSISHQDLKPSNVFIFNDRTSKIGDLGRSQCLDIASPHSVEHFTGDNNYAPPEVWFGHQISDWHERSYSVDCYLLGSMITFYLTGLNMNSLMSQNTSQDLEDYFENGETFIATLPYLVETYERAFLMFEELIKDLHIPEKSELVQVVRILCNPIPQQRIHPSNRLVKGNKYDLQIFISILNRIARKAELSIIN